MGEYFFYVLVDGDGNVVASFNPQHGFGGLKWGEFIGSYAGEQMLQLLRDKFTPYNCVWGTISDYGFMDISVSIETDPYDKLDTVNDLALNPHVRLCALEKHLVSHETLDYMDAITKRLENFWKPTAESMKPALMDNFKRKSARLGGGD